MTEQQSLTIYKQILDTSLNNRWLDLPIIGRDLAARILAIVYVFGGGNEAFTLSHKFQLEREYIQHYYGIEGGEVPDARLGEYLQYYVKLLEADLNHLPEWAARICSDRYGLELHI